MSDGGDHMVSIDEHTIGDTTKLEEIAKNLVSMTWALVELTAADTSCR